VLRADLDALHAPGAEVREGDVQLPVLRRDLFVFLDMGGMKPENALRANLQALPAEDGNLARFMVNVNFH
jgi:hypothetical protein